MRTLVLVLLLALGSVAHAGADWGFNQIKSYVDLAERRLGENDASSARFNLDSASKMLPEASAEAQADPGFARLKARIATLDKQITAKEGAAASTEAADQHLNDASSAEMQARAQIEYDELEKAAEYYQGCLDELAAAVKADPSAAKRNAGASKTFDEMKAICTKGKADVLKKASGDGAVVTDTEQGKAALAGWETAMKVDAIKKPTAMDISAAYVGVDACKTNTSWLMSMERRNGKKVWDPQTTKLGGVSLGEMNKTCTTMEQALKTRSATGCGRHFVGVSSTRASVHDKWGPARSSGDDTWVAIECREMPKTSHLKGTAASFKAKFQAECGKDAVFVIPNDHWFEERLERYLNGDCYRKGTMKFHK